METPSFTFRLERVRTLRERAEEHVREELARELQLRLRGEALLHQATSTASAARDTGRARSWPSVPPPATCRPPRLT